MNTIIIEGSNPEKGLNELNALIEQADTPPMFLEGTTTESETDDEPETVVLIASGYDWTCSKCANEHTGYLGIRLMPGFSQAHLAIEPNYKYCSIFLTNL